MTFIMQTFVIDTNFFINLQRPLELGQNKEQVVENFVKEVTPLVKEGTIEVLTTPESLTEIGSFFETTKEVEGLQKVVVVASPNTSDLKLSAILFRDLVAEIGKRLYRALRMTEEPVKELLGKEPVKDRETEQKYIGELRAKYRRATREGFLDSTVDLDLILLARERNAVLVTSDQGLLMWARKFGCQELMPELFVKKIRQLAKPGHSL